MLRVQDIREIDEQLRRYGDSALSSSGELLPEIIEWYELEKPIKVLKRQAFAHLCDAARTNNDELRSIAFGALQIIKEQYISHPAKSSFIARFAVNQIGSVSNRALQWTGVSIAESEYLEALELFEIARGDKVYSDEKLTEEVQKFISKNKESPDMFGRMASDLSKLLLVISNDNFSDSHQEAARAALVYFVEPLDSIPDRYGPAGYLDDALVVAHALNNIFPERAALSTYLDRIISKWPYLLDLAFEANSSAHPLSEYSVINMALLLTDTEESADSSSVALIMPKHQASAYILGFLCALAECYPLIMKASEVTYSRGDRLIDRDSGEEYFFEGYVNDTYEQCDKSNAVLFSVRQPIPKRKSKKLNNTNKASSDAIIYKPIEHLAALQLSARETQTLRTGAVNIDIGSTRLDALARLFGKTEPVSLPQGLKSIVVVSPFNQTEELAQSLALHGTPLIDVLPTGIARCNDEITFTPWTKDGYGGKQALTVVKSTADALELIEKPGSMISTVIAPIRPDSTDAANLARIAHEGIRVLALLEERDQNSQEIFQKENFKFWAWDKEWLQHLHWPHQKPNSKHQIAKHESSIQTISKSKIKITVIDNPAIELAYTQIREFESVTKDRDDESAKAASSEVSYILLRMLKTLNPAFEIEEKSLNRIETYINTGKQWWPDDVLSAATQVLSALTSAANELKKQNLKAKFIDNWAATHPGGIVIASARVKEQLDPHSSAGILKWMPSTGGQQFSTPVLVPGWLGQARMGRILHPAASSSIRLVLYPPEAEWHESLARRHSQNWTLLKHLSRTRSAIAEVTKIPSTSNKMPKVGKPSQPYFDQILTAHRRQHALNSENNNESDLAEACLVYFAGGPWAAFAPNAKIHTFTHVLESSQEDELPEKPVKELHSGDRVLMVRGSERDVVAHAADAILPAESREESKLWKTALRNYIDSGKDLQILQQELAKHNCKRAIQTIRGWIYDDHRIGPEPLEATLAAIQTVTEDAILGKNINICTEAIRKIRGAHITAGRELQNRVLSRVREWLDSEVSPDELLEVEEQVVLLTVEAVDSELAMVSRINLNRLREDG